MRLPFASCVRCNKRIRNKRQSLALSYETEAGRTRIRHLCREYNGSPGCAEDIFGDDLPDLLSDIPTLKPPGECVVISFTRRSDEWRGSE